MSESTPEHAHKPKFSFSALTKKKVGGIPVIYILLVVAAVGLFLALRMKRSADDTPLTDVEAGDGGVALPEYDNPVFEADAPQGGSVVTPPAPAPDDVPVDQGVPDDAGDVPDAGNVDSQPIPAPTPSPAPVPAPTPAPAPVKARKQGTPGCWHTVESGLDNGPGDLALLYYGKNNADVVNAINAHNTEKPKDGAGHWPVGTKLWIPPDEPPRYFKATSTVRSAPDIAAKNGLTGGGPEVKAYNPALSFPVAVGTNVRIH